MVWGTDYGRMMTRFQILYSQNPYPDQEKKSWKMHENLSFLQKKWLSNAKSRTRNTQLTKFEQRMLPPQICTLKYLKAYSANLPN